MTEAPRRPDDAPSSTKTPPPRARIAWAAATLFAVLAANYVLRPVRDALGISGKVTDLPWLYTGTLVSALLAQTIFGALASRLRRVPLLLGTLGAFALVFVIFHLLLGRAPLERGAWAGRAFFVWMSVFNLLAVSLSWSFTVDVFDRGEGVRWFGWVAAGGTVGGMTGSALASLLAPRLGPVPLTLCGAGFMLLAMASVLGLSRSATGVQGVVDDDRAGERVGGGALAAAAQVARSRHLQLVCGWLVLLAITQTFAYVEQARVVKAAGLDVMARTALFARMDLVTNLLALLGQSLLSAAVMRRLGVRGTLALLPSVTLVGFAVLWGGPRAGLPALSVLVPYQVLRRGLDFAITRPAREVLFTVIPRADKYQAKSFVDSFVYRGGDLVGAWGSTLIAEGLGAPAALGAGMVLCALWLAVTRAIRADGTSPSPT